MTFTAAVTGTLKSTIPTGSVNFNDTNGTLGSASLNASGVATFITSGLSAATYDVTAVYSGDSDFMTNSSTPQDLVISGGGTQTINFNPLANATYGMGVIALAATASSGLPVTFAVNGPAIPNGSALHITGVGLVSVTVSQPGDSNWSAATQVTQNFTVAPALLTVNATNASIVYGQAIPALTFAIAGFVNYDPPSVVAGAPVETTSATSASAPGSYPITLT